MVTDHHLNVGLAGADDVTPFPTTLRSSRSGTYSSATTAPRSTPRSRLPRTQLRSSSFLFTLREEVREVAKTLVAVGKEIAATSQSVEPPAVVLGEKEGTVMVRGAGESCSPNQELVLPGALEFDGPGALAAVNNEDGSSKPPALSAIERLPSTARAPVITSLSAI